MYARPFGSFEGIFEVRNLLRLYSVNWEAHLKLQENQRNFKDTVRV